ncbi:hypothetical protein HNO89_003579 [Sporosarcina luteola]|nr:hypothetical protein [Sporosarcina luteola]
MQSTEKLSILILFSLTIAVYFIDGYHDFFQPLLFVLLAVSIGYSIVFRKELDYQ